MQDEALGNAAAQPILSLRRVSRTFRVGEVDLTVLRDVSLDVAKGEFVAIVGPSGSGKTTLLNLIGGMDRASRGEVRFGRLDLSAADSQRMTQYRREHVGFVFQFFNLVPNLTAWENVEIAAEICEDPRNPSETLSMVGLGDRVDHFPSQLSGGEQQRVAIARAIVKNPSLLLCDEPTGSLDLETGRRVLRLLVDLNRQLGTTVLVITHNLAIADVADRVVHISSGRIRDIRLNEHPIPPEEVEW